MNLLLAVLLSCDDTALAGAAYQEAQEALRESRYDVAIKKLQDAVRLEPRETDRLMYRDRQGRQKIEYYPHYLWAQIRILQARDQKDLQVRMQFLGEALTHLELSAHSSSPGLLEEAKKDLAAAEKAAAVPEVNPAIVALRAEIAALTEQERFEDARERLSKDGDRFPADRDRLSAMIEARRRLVVARYERARALALETASAASPLEKPDLIPSLLEPALLPTTVEKAPDRAFLWLRDFLGVYAQVQPLFQQQDRADSARVLQAMRAFEGSAGRAAEAGDASAFRLAARLADVLRDLNLELLWRGADEAAIESFLDESRRTLQHRQALLPKEPIVSPLDVLEKAGQRLKERRALRRDLEAWTDLAAHGLADRSTMASPVALRAIARDESALEFRPRWSEMSRELEARVLFHRALLDLVADVLGGDAPATRAETAARIRKARLLDSGVETAWVERLSPKIRSQLAGTDR